MQAVTLLTLHRNKKYSISMAKSDSGTIVSYTTARAYEDCSFDDAVLVECPRAPVMNKSRDASLGIGVRSIDILNKKKATSKDNEIEELKAIVRKQAEDLRLRDAKDNEGDATSKDSVKNCTIPHRRKIAGLTPFKEYLAEALRDHSVPGIERLKGLDGMETFALSRKEADDLINLVVDLDAFINSVSGSESSPRELLSSF